MNDVSSPSWLDKISNALLGEPKDREQLINLLRDAHQRNLLDSVALEMIEGVLNVSEMRVREVMVPRSKMNVIQKDASFASMLPKVVKSAHSRYPVIGEGLDDVVGILLAKDLLSYVPKEEQENFNIKDIMRPTVFVPESKRLDTLLHEFRKNRNHMAIVVDEYGNITGLITIEDVLEQIVGEIEDEHDIDEAGPIRKHKENLYSIKALTTIEEFNEYFDAKLHEDGVDTIGGMIMKAFGHLPKRGESINLDKFKFTVVRADKRRIRALKASIINNEAIM